MISSLTLDSTQYPLTEAVFQNITCEHTLLSYRSLPDFNDLLNQRYYAGCRWIFNPFTKGYDQIRSYLVPRKKNINFIILLSTD